MEKIITILLYFTLSGSILYSQEISSLSSVTMAGSIIKTKNTDIVKKYQRKNCPVCRGKGWYISGDGIAKVDCGYCEPEKKQNPPNVVVHPPVTMKLVPENSADCRNGACIVPQKKK